MTKENLITIYAEYACTATAVVDIAPKTWDDVSDWYIKWDTLYIQFEGDENWKEYPLESDTSDGIDMKRPHVAQVWAGKLDFEEELAEQTGF